MLAFVLSDNGLGLSSDGYADAGKNGIGLTNTRTRLRYLYGDAHEFVLTESTNGGVAVKMKIPFRESTEEI